MSITRKLFERRVATGPWGSGDRIPPNSQSGGAQVAGVNMSDATAVSIMTVLACGGLLADAVSTLPIDAFVKTKGSRVEVTPTPTLLVSPYDEISAQDWLAQVTWSMALRGNFYGYAFDFDPENMFLPRQIMPLNPDAVSVRRNQQTGAREYRIGSQVMPAATMVHIPYITTPGALMGINPVQACRQGLALTLAAEASGARFFENGTLASGVISAPGDLNPEQTIALATAWAAAHQGAAKAHLPAVLTGGATWTQMSVNPDDAQFLATRAFQRSEIMMMFRIPPHMLGDVDRTTSWGTGIEQQEQGFVTNTLSGYCGRIQAALTPLVDARANTYCGFNFKARLRGDTLQRFQAYTMARNGSWMNVDEIRELEDQAPLPDGAGQDYWAPLNYAPISSFPAQPAQPAQPPATGSVPT